MTNQQVEERFDIQFNGSGNWLWKEHPAPPPIVEDRPYQEPVPSSWEIDGAVIQAMTASVSRRDIRSATGFTRKRVDCSLQRLFRAKKITRGQFLGRIQTYQRAGRLGPRSSPLTPDRWRLQANTVAGTNGPSRHQHDGPVYAALNGVPQSMAAVVKITGLPRYTVERAMGRLTAGGTVQRVQMVPSVTYGRLAYGYTRT